MKNFKDFVAEQKDLIAEEVTVAVHKAYPGAVKSIHDTLHKFHSDNGKPLSTSEHGDYVHIKLPAKGHNSPDAVKRTLKPHEGSAYSPENVT
jgi:hypothetical protein